MMLFGAPAFFLTLIVACVAASLSSRVNDSDSEVARRCCSIPKDQEIPEVPERPWPLGKDGFRTITYCLKDVYSYHQLSNMFELGLAKWEPAMRLSALRFAPGPACQQQPCLCDEPSVAKGSLQIGLATGDRPAAASVGYIEPDLNVDKRVTSNVLGHCIHNDVPLQEKPLETLRKIKSQNL